MTNQARGFILTTWDVKVAKSYIEHAVLYGFILTTWDVKQSNDAIPSRDKTGFILTTWDVKIDEVMAILGSSDEVYLNNVGCKVGFKVVMK